MYVFVKERKCAGNARMGPCRKFDSFDALTHMLVCVLEVDWPVCLK